MKINLFGIKTLSLVDGEGLRYVVFTQGCPHHCPGCHNPESHDPEGGYEVDTQYIIEDFFARSGHLDGITFSGGEPFMQEEALVEIAEAVHLLPGKDVWSYTGFTYEELKKRNSVLLDRVDTLVDGKFVEALRDENLAYRGSSNQRILKLKEVT